MSSLITSDIHLTTNAKESERWGLLPWMLKQAKVLGCKEIIMCGDGTDAKDRHPAMLVNTIVKQITNITDEGIRFIWNRGNHDYYDINTPFFGFLNNLPESSLTDFIEGPWHLNLSIGQCLFLPNTLTWEEDWKDLDFSKYDYVFAHQTFNLALSETGRKLEGIPSDTLDAVKKRAYSGDIHVPQRFGKKGEYIGSPYLVHYGDTFKPRVLHVGTTPDGKHQQQDLYFPTKGKHLVTLEDASRMEFQNVPKGASVKLRIKVSRADLPNWEATKLEVKRQAKELGWELDGIELVRTEAADTKAGVVKLPTGAKSPTDIFAAYCDAKQVPALSRELGATILRKLTNA